MRKPPPPIDWPARFLAAFARTGNKTAAAKRARVSRDTVYALIGESEEFARAVDAAREEAYDRLEQEAHRRAFTGTLEPVFYQGEKCGAIRRYSDTLLMFLLKADRPERFAERRAVEHSGAVAVTHDIPSLDKLRAMAADELMRLHRETLGLPEADR